MKRTFSQLSRAWYASANITPERRAQGFVDDFSLTFETDGRFAECTIVWHDLGWQGGVHIVAPRLEVFEDQWWILPLLSDLYVSLAALNDTMPTPKQLGKTLLRLGFEDVTPVTQAQSA